MGKRRPWPTCDRFKHRVRCYFPRMYRPSIVHQCPIHCPFIFHEVAPIFHTSASNFPQTFHQCSINVHPHFPSFPPFPFISPQTPFTMDNIPSIPSPCIDCIIRSNVRHGCSVVAPCCNPFSIHAINALSKNFPSIISLNAPSLLALLSFSSFHPFISLLRNNFFSFPSSGSLRVLPAFSSILFLSSAFFMLFPLHFP